MAYIKKNEIEAFQSIYENTPKDQICMEIVALQRTLLRKKDWPPHRFIRMECFKSKTWINEMGNKFRIPPEKYSYYKKKDWTVTTSSKINPLRILK